MFAGILIAAVAGTLWAVGVRDWRCYGMAFLWSPILAGVHGTSVSILLGLRRRSSGGSATGRPRAA